jgi:iron complex outermembrane receptor protein
MGAHPRRISNLRSLLMGSSASLAVLFSGFVVAENTQPPEQLQEVVVTAQYRAQNLQDTPIAITAITSEMIEQQGASKLSDILTNAPSVVFRQQSAAFGFGNAFIRGFGQAVDPAFEPVSACTSMTCTTRA